MKLVIIGASYKFVKRVVNDFILAGEFEDASIVVVDIAQEPLDIVVRTAKTIIAGSHSNLQITGSTNRAEALQDAHFVLVSISVGGLQAMQDDVDMIRKYGLLSGKENTTGPAALMESLRIVPVMLDIAKDMEQICPDAWMINVSNPMAANVRVVAQYTRVKVLGLCHGSADGIKTIANIYGVDSSEVDVQLIGVNHMTFATDIRIKGQDVMDTFYDDFHQAGKDAVPHHGRLSIEFFKQYQYFPLVGDGYLPAFLPYLLELKADDHHHAMVQRESMKQLHLDIANGKITDFAPTHFSGEHIHGVILSLHYGREQTHIVNIPNLNINSELVMGAVIESPAMLSKDRLEGVKAGKGHASWMTEAIRNWNVIHDLIVEAAVHGDRSKAKEAMLLDPAVRNADVVEKVPELIDALIANNLKFLPSFNR